MNDDALFLMNIWESISDLISNSDKQEAANNIVGSFIENGSSLEELYDADGECTYLDRALAAAQIEHDEENGVEEGDFER